MNETIQIILISAIPPIIAGIYTYISLKRKISKSFDELTRVHIRKLK
jgi:hypothetical protein